MVKKNKGSNRKQERDAVFHPELRPDLKYWVETERKAAFRTFDVIEAVNERSV